MKNKKYIFESMFFANYDEWTFFLNSLGVPENEHDLISQIEVTFSGYEIIDTYHPPH